ncbi:MAG: TadE family protein [Pseudomonadota bacterium]
MKATIKIPKFWDFKGLASQEAGSSTVEFVVVLPVFLMAFFWVFDTGFVAWQLVQLDRGVEITTRELMINDITSGMSDEQAHNFLRSEICENSVISGCEENLFLVIDTFANFSSDFAVQGACVNRLQTKIDPTYEPTYLVNPGGPTSGTDLVVFKACLLVDPFLSPAISVYEGTPTSEGAIEVYSVSAFVNEPS